MSRAQPVHRFTVAEYYERERAHESKCDFYAGAIFAMAGGTERHSRIATNICGELHARLKGKPCAVYESNLRIKIKATGLRTYPDASVFCQPPERDEEDPYKETFTNPTLLVEVLSKSTEAYDRGFKAQSYRRLESLKTYVLVSQKAPYIETHERQVDGRWVIREFEGIDSVLALPAIGAELPLADIYDRVDFSIAGSDDDWTPSVTISLPK